MSACSREGWFSEHRQGGEWDATCPDPEHAAALERRRAGAATRWDPIIRGEDLGGVRDFLADEPIHCGAGLELQETEEREDDFGPWTVALPTAVRVRYETEGPRVVLYHFHGGYLFAAHLKPYMRFRWPERGR